jgi:hypothetical protein
LDAPSNHNTAPDHILQQHKILEKKVGVHWVAPEGYLGPYARCEAALVDDPELEASKPWYTRPKTQRQQPEARAWHGCGLQISLLILSSDFCMHHTFKSEEANHDICCKVINGMPDCSLQGIEAMATSQSKIGINAVQKVCGVWKDLCTHNLPCGTVAALLNNPMPSS